MQIIRIYGKHCRTRLTIACAALALGLPALIVAPAALAQSQPSVSIRAISTPQSNVLLVIDNKVVELDATQLVRGQVMVWVRELERLGWGTCHAEQPNQTVFKGKEATLTFTKGKSVALVNSLAVQLPIDTFVKDQKLMVPLSFVAKALGHTYELEYRPVAWITTEPSREAAAGDNSIRGRILYNGRGVEGVRVRATDREFVAIKNAYATTDADGNYEIRGLPDGEYMAYVYVKDNPSYFNRASAKAVVDSGRTVEIAPVSLGRILAPLTPKPGETAAAKKGQVGFAWAACEGASSYKLVVRKRGERVQIVEIVSSKPAAQVPAGKLASGIIYEAEVTATDGRGQYLGGTAGAGGTPWTFKVETF